MQVKPKSEKDKKIDEDVMKDAKEFIDRDGHAAIDFILKHYAESDLNRAFGLAAKITVDGKYKIYEGHTKDDGFRY
jgi:hypothetical protein